ncbi:hypothetical protein GGQ21_001434 [Salinibacter ruber]|uniref:porin family protein n=1 Tax=Salinibacter ruber TaxID=146919 RepID=UPI00216833A6|nr:porin family protein [Salinibacter ruber]MCS3670778.1 hypothetical protein [Salinibacter ruber]
MLPPDPSRSPAQAASFLVLLMGVCLILAGSVAPRAAAQDARVGLRTGPTFGFLSDSAIPFTGGRRKTNANPRLDLHAGAVLLVPLTDAYFLQPELLYIQKGGHFSQPLSERYSVERYRLSYVQGLMLGRRALPIRGRLSAHAVAGLSVDVALRGTVQRDARSARGTFEDRIDLLDDEHLRRWDVGLVVGAGLEYGIGATGRLGLALRYNPGLRSVFAGSEDALGPSTNAGVFPLSAPPSTLRHDVVTASLTYTVPLQLF